jgi:hypothetical protein
MNKIEYCTNANGCNFKDSDNECLYDRYCGDMSYDKPSPEKNKMIHLGMPDTIGKLKDLIKNYPDNTSFGFRNQPMQNLFEVKYNDEDEIFVVFDQLKDEYPKDYANVGCTWDL